MLALYLGSCDIRGDVPLPKEPPKTHKPPTDPDQAYTHDAGPLPMCGQFDSRLPWSPARFVPYSQLHFGEVASYYFNQEPPAELAITDKAGAAIVNKYYAGWQNAYSKALSGSYGYEQNKIERIAASKSNLHKRHDEALEQLKQGDVGIVEQTLEFVRSDRRMAIEMSREQAKWAPVWIQEVWILVHGKLE